MKLKGIHAGFIHCNPGHHRAFNRWHDFDHRPENQTLPNIFHSQRWVATPDDIAARERVDETYFDQGGGQYLVTYWTEGTLDELNRDMITLREQLKVLGRFDYEFKSVGMGRDMKRWGRDRRYDFVKAWTAERMNVTALAVALAAQTGIYVVLSEVIDGPKGEAWGGWYDMTGAREILKLPGFTAALRFATLERVPTPMVLDFYYLDRDPLECAAAFRALKAERRKSGQWFPEDEARNVLIAGPYRPIIPGRYDFYD